MRIMTNTKGLAPSEIGIKPAPKDPATGLPRAYVNGKLRYEITGIDAYGNERIVYGTRTQAMRVIAMRAFGVPPWQDDDLCACGVAEKPRNKPVEACARRVHSEQVENLHMQKLLDTVELVLREPTLSHLDDDVCEAPARDVTDAVSEASLDGYATLAEAREDALLRRDTLVKAREARLDVLRNSQAFANALTMWNVLETLCRKHDRQEARLYRIASETRLAQQENERSLRYANN